MKTRIKNILIFGFLALQLSCYQDSETKIEIEETDPPKTIVDNNLVVVLQDQEGLINTPVSVFFSGKESSIGNLAVAIFQNDDVDKYHEIISIYEEGEPARYHVANTIENQTNYLHIPKISNFETYLFDPSSNLPSLDNSGIELSDRSFRNEDGLYLSDVKLKYKRLDIQNPDEVLALPSRPFGINPQGFHRILNIVEAFYLEATDEQSELLKLDPADMDFDVSKGGSYYAFDTEKGKWIAISDQPINSGYIILANDQPYVELSGTITINGNPLEDHLVKVESEQFVAYAHTTSLGTYQLHVPADELLKVTLLADCAGELEVTTGQTDIKDQNIDLVGSSALMINGGILNCEGESIEDKIYKIQSENGVSYCYRGGEEVKTIELCNDSYQIQALDLANDEQSYALPLQGPNNTIESMFACQERSEYIILDVEGEKLLFENLRLNNNEGRIELALSEDNQDTDQFILKFDEELSEEFIDERVNIVLKTTTPRGVVEIFCNKSETGCGFEDLTIELEDQQAADVLKGHFEGRFWGVKFDSNVAGYMNIKGDFLVKK